MGEIGARLSDVCVVTSDNPRSETPEAIIDEIVAGIAEAADGRPGRGGPPSGDRAGARRGGAGRHGRDRGQGPRAGPGARRRAQDPLRRSQGRRRGARARPAARSGEALDRALSRSDRVRRRRRGGPRRRRRAPGARRDRLPARSGRGISSSACPASASEGGEFAAAALEAGAWGVVVAPEWAHALAATGEPTGDKGGWVLAAPDPLAGLQGLARAWRRELACPVVGITGSVGKTSVKDICHAILPLRVHASPRELQHRDRAAAGDPGRAARDRGAGAGDGDARPRADRRALRDRRAGDRRRSPTSARSISSCSARSRRSSRRRPSSSPPFRDGGRAVVPADAEALRAPPLDSLVTITFGAGGDVFARSVRARSGARSRRRSAPRMARRGFDSRSPRHTTSPTPWRRSRSGWRSRRRWLKWRVGRRG